jgi:hypothetical protein
MSDKAILCYICPSICTLWFVVWCLGAQGGGGGGVLLGWYCCSSYGAENPFSSFSPFSSSSIGDSMISSMIGCQNPPLYLSGTYKASHKTAISGSCQQALVGIHNSVWIWWLCEMDPHVGQSLDYVSFRFCSKLCLCISSCGYFDPLLRSTEVSTLWSSKR